MVTVEQERKERAERRNGDLLREVAAVIQSFPEDYNQGAYGTSFNRNAVFEKIEFADGTKKVVQCGSSHCIAGWAAVLDGYKPTKDFDGTWNWTTVTRGRGCEEFDVADVAGDALGLLQQAEGIYEVSRLFSAFWKPKNWNPEDSREQYALKVAGALELLAQGYSIEEVSY